MEQQKRQVAVKIWAKDLIEGTYIKEEGLRPNYVILKDGTKVSRINIIGTVVQTEDALTYKNVYIDDGSAKLSIRSFEENPALSKISIGDVVLVIGRPREFNKEIYVLPEIIKQVTDKKWLEVRALELGKKPALAQANAQAQKSEFTEEEFVVEQQTDILRLVRELDAGSGADYDLVAAKCGNEEKIKRMLETGELFQPSPGKLKVLD